MTKELEIQYLELSLRTLLDQMDQTFQLVHNHDEDYSDHDLSHKQVIGHYKREFTFLTDRVHRSCMVYFELKGVPLYIEKFDYLFKMAVIESKNKDFVDIKRANVYGDEESYITVLFRQFLYPFKAFGGRDKKYLTGLNYLENILRSTTLILTNKKITAPTQESEVYNGVKIVLEATFSEHQAQYVEGHHSFNTLIKCYKPDILIPALNCAVEYKFATTIERLAKTIEDIHVDVKGYANHPIYTLFFAVFYLKTGLVTEMRFKEIWDSKGFPENWKPIFVEGPVGKTLNKSKKKNSTR